ncbi:hypothetical protein E1B28_008475 [Marasmius oreades]|uniref:Uncharacterized protein n=1 Tax=Marasmius oreades TaxID=181124 RepID=A0A9P7RYL2_9AGAR|nr:uncharacterized protein E1B28_008475 [Marasmius oreades]KAG7092099.1 hypothetical protein E1B28_008475 [Marasmius oreades]
MAGNQEDADMVDIQDHEVDEIIDSIRNGVGRFSQRLQETSPANLNHQTQISYLGPALWILSNIIRDSTNQPPPPTEGQPRRQPSYQPRDAEDTDDSESIRTVMWDKWVSKGLPEPGQAELEVLFALYRRAGLYRTKKHYLGAEILGQEVQTGRLPNRTSFSRKSTPEGGVWNRCMGALVLKDLLIPHINEHSVATTRIVSWDNPDKKWILASIKRISDHASYQFEKRKKEADRELYSSQLKANRSQQVRVREYNRRVAMAERLGQNQMVQALEYLGHDGMSSDEELDGDGGA